MNIELTFDETELVRIANEQLPPVKIPCQAAMAWRFAEITHHNFGNDGEDRPALWPALTAKYAREFHQGVQTPKLILTGELQDSIKIDASHAEAATVFTQNEYATMHQFGDGPVPARPFFPIVGSDFTPYTTAQCLESCATELQRRLS